MVEPVKFSSFLQFPLKCLLVTGLNPLRSESETSAKVQLVEIYHFSVIILMMSPLLAARASVIKNPKDYEIITANLLGVIVAVISVSKLLAISRKRKMFNDLAKTLECLFPSDLDDQDVREQYKQYDKIGRVYAWVGIVGPILCLIVIIVKMILSGNWMQKFPIPYTFPFDEYNPKYYGIVFFWFVFLSVNTLYSILAVDLILYSFITLVSIQYKLLCRRLEHLKLLANKNIENELTKIVELHNALIEITENLETIFSFSIFVNFIGSSFSICVIGFQLNDGTNLANLLTFGGLLCGNLMQTLLLCFYGSKLIDASEKLADAAFYTKWDESVKHFTMLIIMRAQKPAVITASRFSVISLSVFGSVSCVAFQASFFSFSKYMDSPKG